MIIEKINKILKENEKKEIVVTKDELNKLRNSIEQKHKKEYEKEGSNYAKGFLQGQIVFIDELLKRF